MTKWAIKNFRFTYAAIFLIIVAGLLTYAKMPRSEDPGYEVRTARVTTYFPGASPERVELLVTDPIEEAIQEIPEVDYIKSESRTGLSTIDVNILEKYSGMRPIWDNLRRKVDRVRDKLPQGVIGPLVDDEFGDVYGTVIAITGEGYPYAELRDLAKMARDEILRLPDVAKVLIYGEQDERVFVDYNEARLSEMGLSAGELRNILEQRNIILPGGHVSNNRERINVEPSGNFESLDDLRHTVINLPETNNTVYLKDIADVSAGYAEPPTMRVRYDEQPALVLAISMKEGGNIIQLGEQIMEEIKRMEATYPVGINFEIASFQTEVVTKIIDNFTINLIESVVIVMLVMLISLGLRVGLLVASLIPTIILLTFVVMSMWGITLDQISLAALVIALGLFVDNSIVMTESILSEVNAGKDPTEAAIRSARELSRPLLIASLAVSCSFLPIYLAPSSAGEYTRSIFQVVFIALMGSWVLSMTMSPLLAAQFLRPQKKKKESLLARLAPYYAKLLEVFLKVRGLVVLSALGLIVLAIVGLEFVPKTFFPNNDRPMITIGIELPSNTPIEKTEEVVIEFEKFLETKDTVIDFTSYVGAGAPRFVLTYSPESPRPDYAYIMVNTTSDEESEDLLNEVRQWGESRFLDATLTLRRLEYGPLVRYPIEIRIQGKDYEELMYIANEIKQEMESIPGTVNVNDDWGRQAKKMVVRVDQERALRAGITSQDVANSVQTYLTGIQTSEFRRDEDVIPILLRSDEPDREAINNLQNISIFSQTDPGRAVPLAQVADVETVWQPPKIFRRNTLRRIKVRSDLQRGTVIGDVYKTLLPWLEKESQKWPPGYFFEIGGEQEESEKASSSITEQIPMAVLVILLLLMAQFNSVRRTFIIMCTVPLGLIGVTIGMFATGISLGFITFLGIIALSGIVINNGVVLIDRIRIEREAGAEPYEAIILAARRRFVPILLTTATTVGGMIPLVFGGGPMFSPMAIAIVFGLAIGTCLNLFMIPVLFALFFKVKRPI